MDRKQKAKVIEFLRHEISEAALVVVTQQSGLSASEVKTLRDKVNEAGASYKVTKNRLAKIAVHGTKSEVIAEHFKGVTALAYSKDPIAAAKVAVEYANSNQKFRVICGIMGNEVLNASDVKQLASLPSLPELRARILAVIQAPATKLAQVIQAVPAGVARVISAHVEKQN